MFDDATFDRTAASFENPDFVDVVIHSYRHRHGNVAGDDRYADIEARLAALPRIDVPTIVLHGAVDGVKPPQSSEGDAKFFTSRYERRVLNNVGHNPAQEAPTAFAQAILDICKR
jgi:pimeloyl-ACP methyl ester carboxylesterase